MPKRSLLFSFMGQELRSWVALRADGARLASIQRSLRWTFAVLALVLGQQLAWGIPLIVGKELSKESASTQTSAWSAEWNLGISAADSKGPNRSVTRGEFSANLRAQYRPSNIIELSFHPLIRFDTGAKSIYTLDDTTNANYESTEARKAEPASLRLLQASATVYALNYASLEAGILEQDHFIVDRVGWMGGRGRAGYFASQYKAYAYAEQMIVSTLNYSSQIQEVEKTPTLHRAGIEGSIKLTGLLEAKASFGKYSFVELPEALATESAFRGNLVDSTSLGHYTFKSSFEGTDASLRLSVFAVPSVRLFADGDYITNDSAYMDHGHGWKYKMGAEFGITSNIQTSLDYGVFMFEPDARLAAFSMVGSNISGSAISNNWHFSREHLRVGITVLETEPIYRMPLQEENRQIWINLETDYAKIL